MWRCPLTSWPPLIPSLSSSGGGSSGNGPYSAQVGLHGRWDVKSWHTIGHESLQAWAVSHRGWQETTGLVSLMRWQSFERVHDCGGSAVPQWPPPCQCRAVFVLASQHVETFLAQSVLLRETHPLPESLLPPLATPAILYSSFLLFEDIFMGSWDIGTLHLGNSFSPSQQMVFEVVLVPEWTEHLYSSNKYPLFVFQIHCILI